MLLQRSLVLSILLGFMLSSISGPVLIPVLKKVKAGQSIREDGPETHFIKKGTPTMGGLSIIPSSIIAAFILAGITLELLIVLLAFVGFGLIGFLDDYIKVVLKRPLGLRAYQKMTLQLLIAVLFMISAYWVDFLPGSLYIPYIRVFVNPGFGWIPFLLFVIIGTVNSVNLTDGIDGLASGVTVIVAGFFSLVAWHMGMKELSWFSGALSGSCLGFLIFNIHPARIFMGDTGSLALGGAIAALAIVTNLTLLLPVVGGIFFIETLSVIIQVAGYKATGKRVFRMSPLHHHFELKGWTEWKVVMVFWSFSFLFAVIGITAAGS